MKLNQEIKKIEKGCGKEFDIINYGYVKCGGFYYNIQILGDSSIALCSTCKTKLKGFKKGADLMLEDIKEIVKNEKVSDGYDIKTASLINEKLNDVLKKLEEIKEK